jgi:hypothetical protein
MPDDGRTTLGKLARGDVFRTEDGRFWRKEMTRPDGRCYCHAVATTEVSGTTSGRRW